jgi:hypothetical protein
VLVVKLYFGFLLAELEERNESESMENLLLWMITISTAVLGMFFELYRRVYLL